MAYTITKLDEDAWRYPYANWMDDGRVPNGAIDHDGWGYVYMGPHYNHHAAMWSSLAAAVQNFSDVVDNIVATNPKNNNASNSAPTHPPSHVPSDPEEPSSKKQKLGTD